MCVCVCTCVYVCLYVHMRCICMCGTLSLEEMLKGQWKSAYWRFRNDGGLENCFQRFGVRVYYRKTSLLLEKQKLTLNYFGNASVIGQSNTGEKCKWLFGKCWHCIRHLKKHAHIHKQLISVHIASYRVYIYIYIYICMYVCMYIYTYIHTCVDICIYIHTHVLNRATSKLTCIIAIYTSAIHVHTRFDACINTYIICIHAHICYICTHMFTCIYLNKCMHAYTHSLCMHAFIH
jgi:hypothetical protein